MIKKDNFRNSLVLKYPALAKEWHPTKNKVIEPDKVRFMSHKKVWWQCKNGHEWEAIIANRLKGSNCPYCVGRKPINGETDLATIMPKLAKEWHPIRNGRMSPINFTKGSSKKVWWKCKEGHEWEATIRNRSKGSNCPYCAGRKPINGETDLATLMPKLAKEWHPIKNGKMSPINFTKNSGKRVWWQCKEGHEWEATINNRSNGNGCPYCSGHRPIKGETDLETVNPKLAKEWNYSKNGLLKPDSVSAKSEKKIWWQCKKGHEWKAIVGDRSRGRGCPYCSGHKPIKGETDLATLNPKLVKEWHKTKNGCLKPSTVTANSNKKVWWRCTKGHEWLAIIRHRNNGSGCPYCAGQKPIKGETDLKTLNSVLAREWHPSKNGTLKPDAVTANSGKKVWWLCAEGHEWRETIVHRNKGSGCPICK